MQIDFLDPDLSTWIAERETPPRSPGRHVSDVVVSMLKTASPRRFGHYGRTDDTAPNKWQLGYLWEDVLANALRARVAAPEPGWRLLPAQEIRRGALYGTPDRVLVHRDGRRIVEEIKATWLSSSTLDLAPENLINTPRFAYWILQAKTYAAMLLKQTFHREQIGVSPLRYAEFYADAEDPPPVPDVHIRALFVNGDYRYAATNGDDLLCRPLCWKIRWERHELDAWWTNVEKWIAREETPTP